MLKSISTLVIEAFRLKMQMTGFFTAHIPQDMTGCTNISVRLSGIRTEIKQIETKNNWNEKLREVKLW